MHQSLQLALEGEGGGGLGLLVDGTVSVKDGVRGGGCYLRGARGAGGSGVDIRALVAVAEAAMDMDRWWWVIGAEALTWLSTQQGATGETRARDMVLLSREIEALRGRQSTREGGNARVRRGPIEF